MTPSQHTPRPRALQRDQRTVTVGTTDVVLLGPNVKRRALLIGAPIPPDTQSVNEGTLTSAADTSTTGVKSTYTVPAGVQAVLTSATMFGTTGSTQVAALQLVRGATTVNLFSATGAGTWTGVVPLQTGDVINWRCTTAVGASVTDFSINVQRDRLNTRITISLIGTAVAEQGLTLSPGTLPLYLHEDHIGTAIQHEIHAISNVAGVAVPVVDVFDA
jgi:hypothetical protein